MDGNPFPSFSGATDDCGNSLPPGDFVTLITILITV